MCSYESVVLSQFLILNRDALVFFAFFSLQVAYAYISFNIHYVSISKRHFLSSFYNSIHKFYYFLKIVFLFYIFDT